MSLTFIIGLSDSPFILIYDSFKSDNVENILIFKRLIRLKFVWFRLMLWLGLMFNEILFLLEILIKLDGLTILFSWRLYRSVLKIDKVELG